MAKETVWLKCPLCSYRAYSIGAGSTKNCPICGTIMKSED